MMCTQTRNSLFITTQHLHLPCFLLTILVLLLLLLLFQVSSKPLSSSLSHSPQLPRTLK